MIFQTVDALGSFYVLRINPLKYNDPKVITQRVGCIYSKLTKTNRIKVKKKKKKKTTTQEHTWTRTYDLLVVNSVP